MAKIVAIAPEVISIGMDDGTLKEVPADAITFVPHIGDEVEIFESPNKIIVSKKESVPAANGYQQQTAQQPQTGYAPPQQPQTGYVPPQLTPNIIITNTNSNVNTNTNMNTAGMGKPKNKWVALILCLFLGYFGAHKFYEGKVGMGIVYLFTVGLFGIGIIIDIIAILGKPNPYYV